MIKQYLAAMLFTGLVLMNGCVPDTGTSQQVQSMAGTIYILNKRISVLERKLRVRVPEEQRISFSNM